MRRNTEFLKENEGNQDFLKKTDDKPSVSEGEPKQNPVEGAHVSEVAVFACVVKKVCD